MVGEDTTPTVLSDDRLDRLTWMFKTDDQTVDIIADGKTFHIHRDVITRHSGYFQACLKEDSFAEGRDGVIRLGEEVQASYLALYVNLAYKLLDLPTEDDSPDPEEVQILGTTIVRNMKMSLVELVEVWVLCDRFLNSVMQEHVKEGIHWALLRHASILACKTHMLSIHAEIVQDCAKAYKVLELKQLERSEVDHQILKKFTFACSQEVWAAWATTSNAQENLGFVISVARRALGFNRY